MANYRMVVQYDGTNYKGWQIQNSTNDTIQGKLQNILSILAGSPVEVIGSGRTDAGVHALGQVANFHIDLENEISASDLMTYINEHLPEDIAVTSLTHEDERFHARYSEKGKTYRYRIHVSPIANVFEKRFIYSYTDMPLNIEDMRKAAALLTGQHDYKSFCGNKHIKKSTVRTITSIDIKEVTDDNGLREVDIYYSGDGFLQNMIRILTGTLIEVGTGRRAPESMSDLLEAKNREAAGYTAPPQGLCLMEVYY